MPSVSEVVEAAFSDVSFGLDGDHRLELVTSKWPTSPVP